MKTAVYPFDVERNILVKYRDLLKDYEIVSCVCDRSSPLEHEDAGVFFNNKTGIKITKDLKQILNVVEAIILLDVTSDISDLVIESSVKVLMLEEQAKIYENFVNKLGSRFILIDYTVSNAGIPSDFSILANSKLHNIDIPIVTVMGMGEQSEKFDVQLYLRRLFTQQGFQVEQIGSNPLSPLFEITTFPEFMFSKQLSLTEKVFRFNQYVYEMIKNTNADLLIIGVPGGIIPINDNVHNDFGEIALAVSQAVKIDVNILCMYLFDNLTTNDFDYLYQLCESKFNCKTEYFNISSTMYNYNEEKEESYNMMEYMTFSKEYVEDKFNCSESQKYQLFNQGYSLGELLAEHNIIERLSNNIEIM